MVVNTVIDMGGSRRIQMRPSTGRINPVNLSGDALKNHERAMERHNRDNELKANLDAAMNSLATANADIDRLNGVIADLRSQIEMLSGEAEDVRNENARLKGEIAKLRQNPKKSKKQKDDNSDTV